MYDRDEETQRHYTGHTEDIQWYNPSIQQQGKHILQFYEPFITAWIYILREKW